jgi:general secretion pathway protein A
VSTVAPPYLAHWGLAEAPFRLEPDPRFAYERADHREGLARILFGITQLGGLVVITGEIGSGKTLLAQTLRQTLDGEGFAVAEVPNPPRTAAALLAATLPAAGGAPAGGSTARLAGLLRARLAAGAARGRRVVIAIDEAQRLDARALDEVRLLTNPSAEGPGAPVVLLGQPDLTPHVERQPQVAQRVVVRYHLGAMTAEEVDAYALHRARVAGADRRIVSKRAARAVHEETGGVPRLVNLLLANALFVAAERGEAQIGEDTIRDLAEDRRMSLEAGSPEQEDGR